MRFGYLVPAGNLVPVGTSLRRYRDLVVGSKRELEALQAAVSGAAGSMSGDGSTAPIEAEV